MQLPVNAFKAALARREPQIGLWLALASPYAAEVVATAGFDWLLVDGEHVPNNVQTVLAQLQALAPYPTSPIVRPVEHDPALIKQYLDIGVLTLLVPMVHSAAQAAEVVAATRYAPRGIRGLGSAITRASRWNNVGGYVEHAERELCVLVQVESAEGIANVAAIARTEGVDGVFFGPADLSASIARSTSGCPALPPCSPPARRRGSSRRPRNGRAATSPQGRSSSPSASTRPCWGAVLARSPANSAARHRRDAVAPRAVVPRTRSQANSALRLRGQCTLQRRLSVWCASPYF